jgi:phosphoglycerate dehydrogenase-like enzyme
MWEPMFQRVLGNEHGQAHKASIVMNTLFRVGFSHDFLAADGTLTYQDLGLSVLDAQPSIQYEFFPRHEPIVQVDQLGEYDAVISLAPRYTAASLRGVQRLTALLRCGVGYDFVDVDACTENDVALFITAGAVNHSVAEATLTWMLALSHRLIAKDQLLRQGRWAERVHYMGSELRGKTLGVVGLGGIGGAVIELLRGFRMNRSLAFDPYVKPGRAAEFGAEVVSLERLMSESDFISVNCPLTADTRNLIHREQIARMKPTAFLINTARGGIVDDAALFDALASKRIAGAATDVFEKEPAGREHPFAQLDNILLAPHCIAWTDELFCEMGTMACRQAVELSQGTIPGGLINREVLERPGFQHKLHQLRQQ